jgi:hypothetical protein
MTSIDTTVSAHAPAGSLKRVCLIAGIAVVFWGMNFLTPKMWDDFGYEYIMGTDQKVETASDIFHSVYNYYMAVHDEGFRGGRITPTVITQVFVLLGKPVFNVFNALVYTALILLLYFHIAGSIRKINILLYAAINLLVWHFVPAWGENFLWLTGTCYFAWSLALILFFLAPFRAGFDNDDYKLSAPVSFLYLLLGILAGVTMENASAGAFLFLCGCFAIKLFQKKKIKLFEALGIVGFFIGLALLAIAPGNHARLDSYEIVQQHGFIARALLRIPITVYVFFKHRGALLAGVCVIAALEWHFQIQKKTKFDALPFLYLLAGLASACSMILSPVFVDRAFFPIALFLIVALLSFARKLEIPDIVKRHSRSIVALCLLLFLFSFTKAGVALVQVYKGNPTYNYSEPHVMR